MELNKILSQIKESKPKIIKNKSTKKELYAKEQEGILNKINKILGISNDNNIIYLYDIENDEEKKKQILDLSDSVKKYFKSGDWGVFKTPQCMNNHMLLCKSIYKAMDYQIISKAIDIVRNNEKIRTTRYTIGKLNFTV